MSSQINQNNCRMSRDGRTLTCQTRDPRTHVGVRRTGNGGYIWAKQQQRTPAEALALQKQTGLPICDGTGFPYVKGCYSDMSNWSPGPTPKQCIITNPGTSNLAPNSIYTCGFLW